jgi:hypothetical protein
VQFCLSKAQLVRVSIEPSRTLIQAVEPLVDSIEARDNLADLDGQ